MTPHARWLTSLVLVLLFFTTTMTTSALRLDDETDTAAKSNGDTSSVSSPSATPPSRRGTHRAARQIDSAIYRILGHDRWPLQGIGQTRRNTAFALEHEPQPPPGTRVRQYWILNRIVNTTERALLKRLIQSHHGELLYPDPPLASVGCAKGGGAKVNASADSRGREHFATGQNAVRSAILKHAHHSGHPWVIPLDGNQFLPRGFHWRVKEAIREMKGQTNQHQAAMLIPMLRLRHEQDSSRRGEHERESLY